MTVREGLDKVGATEWAKSLFLVDEPLYTSEITHINKLFTQFCASNMIHFVDHNVLGYYHLNYETRTVRGIKPIQYKELLFFITYATQFMNPSIFISSWYRLMVLYAEWFDIPKSVWKTYLDEFRDRLEGKVGEELHSEGG
jgi:hypothetical protein